jgi:putative endonuclease
MSEPWWLYFIECKGGGVYIGISNNVELRYQKHVDGKGAKYTRSFPPIRLLAKTEFPNKSEAMKAEKRMKKLSALDKRRWAVAYGWNPEES